MYHACSLLTVVAVIAIFRDMAEKVKKELYKVTVTLVDGYTGSSGEEVYKIVVPSDSTVEKEIEDRLSYLNKDDKWFIENKTLLRTLE